MYISLMLHAHIPYCRKSGTWPAGEEWLFEALNETYIPLLRVLQKFQQQKLKPKIMIGVVPILMEQLADPYMKEKFYEYMHDKIARAERDITKFSYESQLKHKEVAIFWKDFFQQNLDAYTHKFYGDILGTMKWLQEEGVIEVITSAATHGFLPLLERDSAVYSQIKTGITTYEKYFGIKPKGFWLPECAYRYKEWDSKENKERRSIDEYLADEGIKYFFTENVGIENAEFIEKKSNHSEDRPTTFRGYKLESGVCVFARNHSTGKQVWSSEIGYPGDSYFREFHKKDSESGLHYWRITSKNSGEDKALYDPKIADEHIKLQAENFIDLLKNESKNTLHINNSLLNSQYDCELFGHWWHEGVEWLNNIYKIMLNDEDCRVKLKCISLSEYVEDFSHTFSTIKMGRSSWGENGDFTVWSNPEHSWIWPYINSRSKEFEDVLQIIQDTGRMDHLNERDVRILRQLGRELLLMEGSDWPFLLYTEQAKEYANKRFHNHQDRLAKLIWAAQNFDETNRISDDELNQFEDIDNPWKDLDFKIFQKKD